MTEFVYLPSDQFTDSVQPDLDLAADYLELSAFFSDDRQALSQDIVDALEIAADGGFNDVDDEIRMREDIAAGAVNRMDSRQRVLRGAYPFGIDDAGDVVTFTADEPTYGQAAYLISLVLSNLNSVTPLLENSSVYPTDADVHELRQHFQYFATAAIAAEIVGPAWSFGFPRPDGTGFIPKLNEIWNSIKDGDVSPDPSAPNRPKDDQVDVFARREQRDDLPGYLLAAGQVATGADWRGKSILAHASGAFYRRWFKRQPVTQLIPFHIIPFARPDELFRDDVNILGNVLHRLRVPYRVDEAKILADKGIVIEAFDRLELAVEWTKNYANRGRVA